MALGRLRQSRPRDKEPSLPEPTSGGVRVAGAGEKERRTGATRAKPGLGPGAPPESGLTRGARAATTPAEAPGAPDSGVDTRGLRAPQPGTRSGRGTRAGLPLPRDSTGLAEVVGDLFPKDIRPRPRRADGTDHGRSVLQVGRPSAHERPLSGAAGAPSSGERCGGWGPGYILLGCPHAPSCPSAYACRERGHFKRRPISPSADGGRAGRRGSDPSAIGR